MYQYHEQLNLSRQITEQEKTKTCADGNPGSGFVEVNTFGGVKATNGFLPPTPHTHIYFSNCTSLIINFNLHDHFGKY